VHGRDNMKIVLVIIYYNELRYLEKLFSSLLNQTQKPDNIIFINNNSPDDPSDIIREYSTKLNIDYIRTNKNLFFAKGTNVGLRIALKFNTDIIGCMNSDMWCAPNMIEQIKKEFTNTNVVALTPNIRDLENTKDIFHPMIRGGFFGHNDPKLVTIGTDCYTDFLTGASLFVRSDTLRKTGLFYEPYIHGTEDFELCDRIRDLGKMKYIYSTNIYHQSDPSKKVGFSFERKRQSSKNWYIYCLRNKKSNLILLGFAMIKNLFESVIGKEDARAQLLGKLDGIKETMFHLINNNKYLEEGMHDN